VHWIWSSSREKKYISVHAQTVSKCSCSELIIWSIHIIRGAICTATMTYNLKSIWIEQDQYCYNIQIWYAYHPLTLKKPLHSRMVSISCSLFIPPELPPWCSIQLNRPQHGSWAYIRVCTIEPATTWILSIHKRPVHPPHRLQFLVSHFSLHEPKFRKPENHCTKEK
jgi:hypothetical protein